MQNRRLDVDLRTPARYTIPNHRALVFFYASYNNCGFLLRLIDVFGIFSIYLPESYVFCEKSRIDVGDFIATWRQDNNYLVIFVVTMFIGLVFIVKYVQTPSA